MQHLDAKKITGDILIVDDAFPNLKVLSAILTEHGYEVRGAPNGPTALMVAQADPPDLILLDIRMPDMDGYEVCRRLKADARTGAIPIIFLSALDNPEDKAQGFAVGGVDYITKPFEPQEVLARVATHLALHVLQQQLAAQNAELQRLNQELERRVLDRTTELVAANTNLQAEIAEHHRTAAERTRLLAQVQEQARQVQQLIDTVPEGIILLDDELRLLIANPLGQQYLDFLADALAGDVVTRLGTRPLQDFLTSPPKGLWHTLVMGGDGAGPLQYFQLLARPIETGPALTGWVFVIRDITQQRSAEQRVHQQERLAAVGQLAAGIAHDFNNIMATIVLYAQMVARNETLPPRDQERLAIVNQQSLHATKLIQQILDFSRGADFERRPLDLLPLLKEHVKLLQRTIPENISVELECNAMEEYMISGDPTRLQQVLMNLAVNARDAMPEGGTLCFGLERFHVDALRNAPLPEMLAAGNSVNDWIKLTVSDTGIGIAPETLRHIYEPFFTTKMPGKGTGLGLAQVHGIVGAHDGYIDAESRVGQGTTFTIYLPSLLKLPSELLPQKHAALAGGQGATILIVEDNPTTRQALVESLELLNYRVLTAQNGKEALAVFSQHRREIALVLSDMVMPEMGGQALLHALRQRGETVKIIILTGHPLRTELEQLSGLDGWLLKPASLEQLADMVGRVLSS